MRLIFSKNHFVYMINIVVALVLILISLPSFAQTWKKSQLIVGCNIFTITGKPIRTFPGNICVFLNDGSFLSITNNSLRKINHKSHTEWEISGNFHHQLNLTTDGKKILALSSGLVTSPKGPFREDKFLIISMDGKILHQQSFTEITKQIKVYEFDEKAQTTHEVIIEGTKVNKEISHFNSFYEIPPFKREGSQPVWLKEGNFIINGLSQGMIILSSDLQKVLHEEGFTNSIHHRVHDVQINKKGNILYFNNLVNENGITFDYLGGADSLSNIKLFSGIYEIDALTKKVIHRFVANPPQTFYSWISGGIQELDDDTWLFNHFLIGSYIYSKKTNGILMYAVSTNADYVNFKPSQQTKAQNLNKFLSYWK